MEKYVHYIKFCLDFFLNKVLGPPKRQKFVEECMILSIMQHHTGILTHWILDTFRCTGQLLHNVQGSKNEKNSAAIIHFTTNGCTIPSKAENECAIQKSEVYS